MKYICESTHSVYPYLFTTMYTVYAILARDTQVIWESIPGRRTSHTWENLPGPAPCRSFPQLGESRPTHVSIRPRARPATSNNLEFKFRSLFNNSALFTKSPRLLFFSASLSYSITFLSLICFHTWVVRFESESNRAKFRHDHGILGNRAVEIPREQLPLVVHALQFLQRHAASEFSGPNHVERVSVQMVHQIVEATCNVGKRGNDIKFVFNAVLLL